MLWSQFQLFLALKKNKREVKVEVLNQGSQDHDLN
jgi:hypothetical protein